MHAAVRLRQVAEKRFAVKGTPSDCVIMGVRHILKDHGPDLVLSGVNRGQNVAEDVTYSGTVSAAMEGTLAGVRSVALSQSTPERPVSEEAFAVARAWGARVVRGLIDTPWPAGVLMNVNFPSDRSGAINGVRVTEQGFRDYGKIAVETRTDLRGFDYHWFGLGRDTGQPGHETDLKAMREGWISVTPLHLDLTHYPSIAPLKDALAHLGG